MIEQQNWKNQETEKRERYLVESCLFVEDDAFFLKSETNQCIYSDSRKNPINILIKL